MGLWQFPSEWDDYEWFRLADVKPSPARSAQPTRSDGDADDAGAAMGRWLVQRLADEPLWTDQQAHRVLLVDLDNLRATPVRLRAERCRLQRMTFPRALQVSSRFS